MGWRRRWAVDAYTDWRPAMTEPKDLLLAIEQLRRSNRFWKALALAACAVVMLAVLLGIVTAERQRRQAEAEMRRVIAGLAEAHQVRVDAQKAANPPLPR